MPISATSQVISGPTLGNTSMFVCAMISLLGPFFIVLYAAQEECKKALWWLIPTLTFWIWGPFVWYLVYFVGSKVVACIDEKNRVEIIIPEKPEIIDMNKAEKP